MKQIKKLLILSVLTAGTLFAQQDTGSVQSILNELNAVVKSPAAEPVMVAVETPADEAPVMAAEKTEKLVMAAAMSVVEPEAVAVVAARPKAKKAKVLMHKKAEEVALKKVDLDWGLILRYYPITARFVESMSLEGIDQVTDIADQFSVIDFPKGSSALYMPDLQKLFVKNTAANLSKLEEVLAAFGEAEAQASMEQVEIEARFVEFSEGALEELGFRWSAPDGADLPSNWSLDGDQNLFSDALRSVPFTQTESLGLGEVRSTTGEWSVNRIEDMFSTDAGTLALSGEMDGNAIDLLINALDQTAGVDVLSAPSITTLSGEAATIVVGERHFYPEVYETGGTAGTMVHVKYKDFGEKILGVEMGVTPTINNDEIKMKINPRITELLGWEKYQLAPANSSYTYYQQRIGQQFEHDPVVAKLPIFKRREIKTEISVANGATIGLGGLIGEKIEAFEDRVPLLGSIPLIGRLFRSEGERAVKRNLMIFVTARKVQPSGAVAARSFE